MTMTNKPKPPQYEGEHYGLKTRAWKKRGYVLVEVDTPEGVREWEMPSILPLDVAADQAAIQSK